MKPIIAILSAILIPSISFATEISLNPGSRVTITASEITTVTCAGEAASNSGKKTCVTVTRGEPYANGGTCSSSYCATLMQFGVPINWNSSSSGSNIAEWCEANL